MQIDYLLYTYLYLYCLCISIYTHLYVISYVNDAYVHLGRVLCTTLATAQHTCT